MVRYLIVSTTSGVLFGLMDALINGNPLAQRFYKVFTPIARESINIPAALSIDLVFGFAMAGIFLLIRRSLPGEALLKGIVFGSLVWFLRVVMQVASQWVMFAVPPAALIYSLVLGLAEMLILGIVYGLTLNPSP